MTWHWMLGIEAVQAAIYSALVLDVPESPRWLALKKKDEAGAMEILRQFNPTANIKAMMQTIKNSVSETSQAKFLSRKFRFPILLAFLLAFLTSYRALTLCFIMRPAFLSKPELLLPMCSGHQFRW